ncbi:C1 family peptidase [Gemmatimonadota bacterium]
MSNRQKITSGLLTMAVILLLSPSVYGQSSAAERQAFWDGIHTPTYLRTDIAHTPIKSQRGGTCWNFATISFLESEIYRTNEAVVNDLRVNRQSLNLSEYYVVYWAWVEKARELVRVKGEGKVLETSRGTAVSLHDGGLSHDTISFIQKYGIVPESEFTQPENSGMMTRALQAVMVQAYEDGNWNERQVIQQIREVLDEHLMAPPQSFEWNGQTYTPRQWADDYLKFDYDNYWEITSYTDFPFYTQGELDLPDNWWDCDTYYNVPLDAYIRIMNRALDRGFSVAVDTDWGDIGGDWNGAGAAVMHPEMLSPMLVSQQTRQSDFEDGRTQDDHLVHAVDHRVVDGWDWYLIKNSHGTATGRQGYVWMRSDWVAMRVLAIMVHKDAIDPGLVAKFQPPN